MLALQRQDLYTLEAYSNERASFRQRVLTHKKRRTVQLGEHFTLIFEDRLTVQYQVQEMLRIERIFEAAAIQEELDAYNPLIPNGNNLKATMLIEFPDVDIRRRELGRLGGIEHRVYAEVTGQPKVFAIADEDLDRSEGDKTSAVHFLRFEFPSTAIAAWRGGASLKFGIDDPRLPATLDVSPDTASALVADFG